MMSKEKRIQIVRSIGEVSYRTSFDELHDKLTQLNAMAGQSIRVFPKVVCCNDSSQRQDYADDSSVNSIGYIVDYAKRAVTSGTICLVCARPPRGNSYLPEYQNARSDEERAAIVELNRKNHLTKHAMAILFINRSLFVFDSNFNRNNERTITNIEFSSKIIEIRKALIKNGKMSPESLIAVGGGGNCLDENRRGRCLNLTFQFMKAVVEAKIERKFFNQIRFYQHRIGGGKNYQLAESTKNSLQEFDSI